MGLGNRQIQSREKEGQGSRRKGQGQKGNMERDEEVLLTRMVNYLCGKIFGVKITDHREWGFHEINPKI